MPRSQEKPAAADALERALSANLTRLKLVRFCYWMHFASAVLIPFLRDWGGLNFTQILGLNAWFMVAIVLLEVPTGAVADRFSRKASLILAGPIGIAAVLVYTHSPSLGLFIVAEGLLACSFTLMSGADEALVYDSLRALGREDEAQGVFAKLEAYKLAGILVGAIAGSLIASALDVTAPLRLQALPLLVSTGLAWTLREPPLDRQARTHRYREVLVEGVQLFARNPVLRKLAFDMVGVGAVCWLIIWLYQALIERAGLGLALFGTVHAAMVVGQIALLSNVDRVVGWLGGRKRLLLLGAVIPGLGWLLLGSTRSLPLVLLGVMLVASFGLSRPPLFTAYMNPHLPSARRATALSTASMLRNLVIAVLNPLIGMLVDVSLSAAALLLGGLALLLGVISPVRERHLHADDAGSTPG